MKFYRIVEPGHIYSLIHQVEDFVKLLPKDIQAIISKKKKKHNLPSHAGKIYKKITVIKYEGLPPLAVLKCGNEVIIIDNNPKAIAKTTKQKHIVDLFKGKIL